MKSFLILTALVSVAMARPNLVQVSPLSNLQAHATASATASLSPQQLSLLRLGPLGTDGRVLNTIQAQAQQQLSTGASPLLSATRLAQSLASLSPTGASSSSSVQLLESPQLTAARARQQQAVVNLRQNVLLARESTGPLSLQSNGLPLLLGSDGQLVAAPWLVL